MLANRIFLIIPVALLLLLSSLGFGEEYAAPSPEPTPEETAILEYINRLRADPKADAERCLKELVPPSVDIAMFKREMAQIKPAAPLGGKKVSDKSRDKLRASITKRLEKMDSDKGKQALKRLLQDQFLK